MKIGLVLEGGGMRGLYTAGVLDVMMEHQFMPDVVCGTSAGVTFGVNQKLPQIGNVVIEDDVEIGANTTVDRAMMGSTVIRRNAKIDNLVQVAHNVEVGESTFLCAQVGIAGSTKVGAHCILAGQVGVAGHIEIADNCVFGAQTGVAGSVRKAGMYQGSPAIDAMNWRRSSVGFKQLPDIMKRLQELEKKG